MNLETTARGIYFAPLEKSTTKTLGHFEKSEAIPQNLEKSSCNAIISGVQLYVAPLESYVLEIIPRSCLQQLQPTTSSFSGKLTTSISKNRQFHDILQNNRVISNNEL